MFAGYSLIFIGYTMGSAIDISLGSYTLQETLLSYCKDIPMFVLGGTRYIPMDGPIVNFSISQRTPVDNLLYISMVVALHLLGVPWTVL